MRKVMIPLLVIGVSAVLGVMAAYTVGSLSPKTGIAFPVGMMGNSPWTGNNPLSGMMGGSGGMMAGRNATTGTGQRLSMEQITSAAETFAAGKGSNYILAEVMEFSNNFYAVIEEKDTGRGVMEILLDPYTGAISPEMGPNTMWNTKYGMMGSATTDDNSIPFEHARELAQKALDTNIPGATVHIDGRTFYGYFTFDYDVDGQTAGMLSINSATGAVWFHTWHGKFIAEKELLK